MSKKNNVSKCLKANGGYFYEVLTNTLHMTKAFQAKANRYGTKECEIVDALTLQNGINPTIKTHTHNRAPRLTYTNRLMTGFCGKGGTLLHHRNVRHIEHPYLPQWNAFQGLPQTDVGLNGTVFVLPQFLGINGKDVLRAVQFLQGFRGSGDADNHHIRVCRGVA